MTTKQDAYRIAHAAGWDQGNRNMREHGRKKWNHEDLEVASAEMQRLLAELSPPPAPTVRHTACRHCGLDIEGFAPFRRGEWRDRGNNTECNDGKHKHAPVP